MMGSLRPGAAGRDAGSICARRPGDAGRRQRWPPGRLNKASSIGEAIEPYRRARISSAAYANALRKLEMGEQANARRCEAVDP